MNTQWKSSRTLLNKMISSETLTLHRRDLISDSQDLLPAPPSKIFIWQSGSLRHRQELLSLFSTAGQRMRSLRTSLRKNWRTDPRNGLGPSLRWKAKMKRDLSGVVVSILTGLFSLLSTPAITASMCWGANSEWKRRVVAHYPSSGVGCTKSSVGDDSSWHLC